MSTVDRGPPQEQTANDAICVHVSTTRTRGTRRGGVAVCACTCVECAQGDLHKTGALPQNKKMSGTSGKIISMK